MLYQHGIKIEVQTIESAIKEKILMRYKNVFGKILILAFV